jgi:hypothetical protein
MTDGYVGNDMEIISEIQKHPNARVFAFGIGSSVNRFLLDKMSEAGRGEVEYVALNDDGSAAARRFHDRVRNPLLTDISVDWNGLPVSDVYPKRIPDLFGAKPVVLTGRYTGAGRGTVRLKGMMSGREFVREVPVDFPEAEAQNGVLSSLWARQRVDDLMSQDYNGAQQGAMKPELQESITNLGLEFGLMTQFTSFVAVEEMIVTDGGQPRRIDVPVEVPEGVNPEAVGAGGPTGLFTAYSGSSLRQGYSFSRVASMKPMARMVAPGSTKSRRRGGGGGGGVGSGSGSGVGGGGGSSAKVANSPSVSNAMVIDGVDAEAEIKSPREQRLADLRAKLHPSLLAVVERLQSKSPIAGPDEAKFVHDGKVELQVWLNEKSAETVDKLKELGFEVVLDPKSAKLVIGRLPIEKLEALADLKFVRYVSPQTSPH